MRLPYLFALCAALAAGTACGDKEPEVAELNATIPRLLVPPQAALVSRAGSADALQLTFVSNASIPNVADYYRRALSRDGWRLVNDATDSTGVVTLYAEQNGPPMWIRIAAAPEGVGTSVEIAGAVAEPAGSAADTTMRVDSAATPAAGEG